MFKKGDPRPPGAGMRKGQQTRIKGETIELRQKILNALDKADEELGDYLWVQAKENPKAFLSLLGRVLPTEIKADIAISLGKRLDEARRIIEGEGKE